MDIKDILAISGYPGLYKLVSQGKNALIVENLETGKRMPAHARHKISALEDIAIFTETEDKPLKEVFQALFEKMDQKEIEHPKKLSGQELKDLFESVVPDYDKDRVYTSDMKKALEWYNVLVKKGLVDLEADAEEEAEEEEAAPKTSEESAESVKDD